MIGRMIILLCLAEVETANLLAVFISHCHLCTKYETVCVNFLERIYNDR